MHGTCTVDNERFKQNQEYCKQPTYIRHCDSY